MSKSYFPADRAGRPGALVLRRRVSGRGVPAPSDRRGRSGLRRQRGTAGETCQSSTGLRLDARLLEVCQVHPSSSDPLFGPRYRSKERDAVRHLHASLRERGFGVVALSGELTPCRLEELTEGHARGAGRLAGAATEAQIEMPRERRRQLGRPRFDADRGGRCAQRARGWTITCARHPVTRSAIRPE